MEDRSLRSLDAHTPGPWEVFGVDDAILIIGPQREGFCEVRRYYGNKRDEANANLIGAAPALLKALQAAKGWISEDPPLGELEEKARARVMARIDAALAKAEGQANEVSGPTSSPSITGDSIHE